MTSPFLRVRRFFFRPVSATGFGLMRIAWGLTVLVYMLGQWGDVTRFYSSAGIFPSSVESLYVRHVARFTLFDIVTDPTAVFLVYLILLLACLCMIIGQWPRLMSTVATLLLFSFHERNPIPLGGGDTVLRLIGFLLILSPGTSAFSLSRLTRNYEEWKKTRRRPAPMTMPIWPQRLLLWQLIVLYTTSAWDKLLGTMWWDGTAVVIPFQHAHFARFPGPVMDTLSSFGPLITYATLVYEFAWLLLLIPSRSSQSPRWFRTGRIKRLLLLGGLLFHGGIFVFLDAGSFSFAMFTAFLGLADERDIDAWRKIWNRRWKGTIKVFYDGACGLCSRAAFWMLTLDWLHRVKLVDFRDPMQRKREAPDLSLGTLDRSMHIRLPKKGDTEPTFHGFRAFRALSRHLPPVWPAYPPLFLPGITRLGEKTYRRIAAKRKKCSHERCG